MKKIAMVEYQGRCDEEQKAVGHGPKVLEEYYDFICNENEVTVYAPKVFLKDVAKRVAKGAKILPEHIVMKGHNTFWEKIRNKIRMFRNIRVALKNADADIVWFFNVEYYLMLYLAFCKKPKQKMVCTLFLDGYHNGTVGKIKQWIFEKAQKKITLIISTGQNFTFKNCAYRFVPDYVYRKEFYESYQTDKKQERAVCLGTMGTGKELEEMVEAFTRIGYPLTVAGRFYEKERFEKLRRMAGENVLLVDDYLTKEEYFQMLAEAKYVVLPYSPSQYAVQTSGVLQEGLFLGTIPVTYEGVLQGNNARGIGFASWENLSKEVLSQTTEDIRKQMKHLVKEVYEETKVKQSYLDIFEKC